MGKGKGKKGKAKREGMLAAREARKAARAPRPENPVKKAKKLLLREKRLAAAAALPTLKKESGSEGGPKQSGTPVLHAKWPSLFKKHIGLIESHIRALDRLMMSMQSQMGQMREKERLEWELGTRGNYRVLCEMMDRARDTLVQAKKCAQGIVPEFTLRDKKGLGVKGTSYELLGPKLAAKAAEMGYTKRGKLGRDPDAVSTDSNDDTDMSDSSSDDDNAAKKEAQFVPLQVGKNVPRFPTVEDSGDDKEKPAATNGVEPNPYFVVDTNPTPVLMNGNGTSKKNKKRTKEEDGGDKKSKRVKTGKSDTLEPAAPQHNEPQVDFNVIEATLAAEVAAAAKAREAKAAEAAEEKKSKKKRRRSSDGVEEKAEKKIKKEKSKKSEIDDAPADTAAEPSISVEETFTKESGKKRKLDETTSADGVTEKKARKDKKEKKRKADADGADVDEDKKKKRKAKVGSESE